MRKFFTRDRERKSRVDQDVNRLSSSDGDVRETESGPFGRASGSMADTSDRPAPTTADPSRGDGLLSMVLRAAQDGGDILAAGIDEAALASAAVGHAARAEEVIAALPWSDPLAVKLCGILTRSKRASPITAIRYLQHATDLTLKHRLDVLDDTIARHSADPYLHIERAKLLRSENKIDGALVSAHEAYRLKPDDIGIAAEYIWMLRLAERYDYALEIARQAVSAGQGDLAPLARHVVELTAMLGRNRVGAEPAVAGRAAGRQDDPAADMGGDPAADMGGEPIAARLARVLAALRDERTPIDADHLALLGRLAAALPPDIGDEACREAREIAAALEWVESLSEDDRALLFEDGFYKAFIGPHEPLPDDVAVHYIIRGVKKFYPCNPFFDAVTYCRSAEPPPTAIPLHHYMVSAEHGARAFHPDIDAGALDPRGGISSDPALLTLLRSAELPHATAMGRGPRSMAEWRERAAQTTRLNRRRPVVDALLAQRPWLAHDADKLLLFFDPDYYASQLRDCDIAIDYRDLLLHFLNFGEAAGFDPHPLIRISSCREVFGDKAGESVFAALLSQNERERRLPHPLLVAAATAGAPDLRLDRYLAAPPSARPALCRMFAATFYERQNPEIDWTLTDPLDHYLAVGARRDAWFHPVVDLELYQETAMSRAEKAARISALEHFETSPTPRPRPFTMFDPDFYRSQHEDIARHHIDPSSHFVQFGYLEPAREFSPIFSKDYLYHSDVSNPFAFEPPIAAYLRQRRNCRTRVLFVGHEASRSGAPAILLQIVRHFASYDNVDCVTILDQGGALLDEYRTVSHAFVAPVDRHLAWSNPARFRASLKGILDALSDAPPELVVCNSAEVRLYAAAFRDLGLRVVFLMHEVGDFYPPHELRTLSENVDLLILPSQFVVDSIARTYPPALTNARLRPQGLLSDAFGRRQLRDRERLLRRNGIHVADHDVLVLGCGTLNGRKGFDLFVQVAHAVRRSAGSAIKFVWVGGHAGWRFDNGGTGDTAPYWASWDIRRSGLDETLFVIPEVTDAEPYFAAGDMFLMSSRADPFPCVIHEAMAIGLPIVCFEGMTGAPEAFGEGGVVVPALDTSAMAEAILSLARDPERRAAMRRSLQSRVRADYRFETYVETLISDAAPLLSGGRASLGRRCAPDDARRRVYFANSDWGVSGVNTFTVNLVRDLRQRGYEAEVLLTAGRFGYYRPPGASFYEPLPEPLPDVPYRVLQPRDASPAAKRETLRRFLLDHAPCILFPGYDYDITSLAKDLPPGIGVIGVTHADDSEHYDHTYQYGPYWNRIVGVSSEITRKIETLNPAFAPKLALIRCGIEPPPAAVVEKSVLVKIASIDPVRLVYAGRFEVFQKRIFDYCRLADALEEASIPFHMTLAGAGSQLEAVRQRLAIHIAAGRVQVPGRLEHAKVISLLQRSHLFLMLSDFEGLPISMIEALQNGCVPVTYDLKSGISEIIHDRENGLILPRGDLSAVVAGVRAFVADPALRDRLVRGALATPQRYGLTRSAMGEQYDALLTRVFAEIDEAFASVEGAERLAALRASS